MKVQQRHIIKCPHLKGLKLDDIALAHSNRDGQNEQAKRNIESLLHQFKVGRKDFTAQHVGARPTLDDPDTEILLVLRRSQCF
jgi:hypothetical protein